MNFSGNIKGFITSEFSGSAFNCLFCLEAFCVELHASVVYTPRLEIMSVVSVIVRVSTFDIVVKTVEVDVAVDVSVNIAVFVNVIDCATVV
jgi:hypothetical protein